MAGLHHPHIVRLLGYCDEYNEEKNLVEQLLVYEFMPNGDLEAFIQNRKLRILMNQTCLCLCVFVCMHHLVDSNHAPHPAFVVYELVS